MMRNQCAYNRRDIFKSADRDLHPFDSQDASTQKEVLETILDGIKKMPPEQQERLRKELNVDKFTEETVRKALVTGSLGAAFAVVVEVAGFSAYIFAVKILAAAAGLVGITLPFAVYTTLTSLMAFLANPLILIPGLLIFGNYLTKRTNRKIRNGLFPIVVTQGVVSSSLNDAHDGALKSFLDAYDNFHSKRTAF